MEPSSKCAVRRPKERVKALGARGTRKRTFTAMESKAATLEISNQALEVRIQELENLLNFMRKDLIQKMFAIPCTGDVVVTYVPRA